jgi:hypothetical protein
VTRSTGASNPLIGTWKVVSFEFEFEGGKERRDAYDQPSGYIIFTADGRMMTVLADSAREPSDAPSSLFDRMMAYSGRHRLQSDDCFIVTVDVAWRPSWIGTEQTRYFKLDGDIFSIVSPQTIRGVIVWKRE